MSVELAQKLNADQTIRDEFISELARSLKRSGVETDEKKLEQLLTEATQPAAQLADLPPLPTVSAHWWGYRVRIHADFLKWIATSGIVIGALIAMLAPILIILGPVGVAIGIALGAYLMAQHAALLIQANNCGGFVCLEALWVAPVVFIPKCCP
jgi:small-conductance mechanosensitive channel